METKKLILTHDIAKNKGMCDLQTLIIPTNIIDKENEINYVVTEIGEDAFTDCKKLENLIIPSTVTQIHKHAFSNCLNLKNVRLAEGLRLIFNLAFAHTDIRTIAIPSSVSYIGPCAFSYCCNLEKVHFLPKGETEIVIDDGCFKNCLLLKDINLPENLEFLQKETFLNCVSLQSLTIPSKVKEIETKFLANCCELVILEFLNDLKYVSEYSIFKCRSLKEIRMKKRRYHKEEWNEVYKNSWE